MVNQNAKVEFDGRTNLTVSGEFLPFSEGEHNALVALLDEANPPQVSVTFRNEKDILSYTLSFTRPAVAPEETKPADEAPEQKPVVEADEAAKPVETAEAGNENEADKAKAE